MWIKVELKLKGLKESVYGCDDKCKGGFSPFLGIGELLFMEPIRT